MLASLNHPNVATLYGFEQDGATAFLVMEVVEGVTLAERLQRGSLGIDEARRIFLQIAEGLEAAHEKGIVHRDLKPANIKINDEGRVKLLDFGLAKAAEESAADPDETAAATMTRGATREGAIMGTAAYMAPEQARGEAVDNRADLWAFGVPPRCLRIACSRPGQSRSSFVSARSVDFWSRGSRRARSEGLGHRLGLPGSALVSFGPIGRRGALRLTSTRAPLAAT